MWREVENVGINGEELSSNMFQFIAHVHWIMRSLSLLVQHENEAVRTQKSGTTIITLKEIQ